MSREEVAMRELGVTDVAPWLARAMVWVFLALIVSVPIVQTVAELRAGRGLQYLEVFGRAPSERNFHEFERALEDASVIGQWILPRMQSVLTRLGVGNEQAYVDRDGWLFYRPGVDYVTGPPFLDPAVLRRRTLGGKSWEKRPEPNPIPAIVDFAEQLRERGIELVLMPTVVKAQVDPTGRSVSEPEGFSNHLGSPAELLRWNPSQNDFEQELRRRGVRLLSLSTWREDWQFLRTDSHWTPSTMDSAATAVASEIRSLITEPSASERSRSVSDVTNVGDIATMLRLPEDQHLFPLETVTIQPVANADGTPWQPDPDADVLVLGDSFSNIYSLEGMGWGAHAGFVETLSFHLQRPVDRITINDGGSHATRRALRDELARGNDRLAGKKVVIWQFAIRELAVGDWPIYEMPRVAPRVDGMPTDATPVTVRGRIAAHAGVPRPGTVAYRDCITALHLREIGTLDPSASFAGGTDAVVFVWGMRDNVWTDAARWSEGDTVELNLVPWAAVTDEFGSYQRRELDDDDLMLLEPYWGTPR